MSNADKIIKVEHPNGYSGVLYGKRSMVIFKDGKEVLHTGFRNKNIKTADDLYKVLEEQPKLMKILDEKIAEIEADTGDDEV